MTADVLDVAERATQVRQQLIRRAVIATRNVWRVVDANDIRRSWASGPRRTLLGAVSAAQLEAAVAAEATITAMLKAQGLDAAADFVLAPASFAGVASDGRDLGRLLDQAVIAALVQIQQGRPPGSALQSAGRWLDQAVRTQVADASRAATQASTVTHRSVGGFYRIASYPCCSRCSILAGRWYRATAAFQRHPRCDCSQVAAPRRSLDHDERIVHPQDYFDSLSREMQDRLFTAAGAKAIRDGADITKVVNARRNMASAGRLDALYRRARTRDEAIELLRSNGFIRDEPRTPAGEGGATPPKPPKPGPGLSEDEPIPFDLTDRTRNPPPDITPGTGTGAGARPLVGDLIPQVGDEAEFDRIEDDLAAVMQGRHGPFVVDRPHIDRELSGIDELLWTAQILTPDGAHVGFAERTYFRQHGALNVFNDLLELGDQFRGKGFAKAFDRYTKDWYIESRVEAIYLTAGLEDGGYVWARAGYGWRNERAPYFQSEGRGVVPRLQHAVAAGNGTPAELAAAREILLRFRTAPFDSVAYPTPLEVAMLGWSEGRTTWLGRNVMRGSQWDAVLTLQQPS